MSANTIDAEAEVYKKLGDDVELSGKDFTNYLYYDGLLNKNHAKMLVGVPNAIVSFGNIPVSPLVEANTEKKRLLNENLR